MDDEPRVLEALLRTLRGRYDVVTALGGAEGLRVAREDGPFSVIVSDLRMPQVDGISVLRGIRELHGDTVRILLSGHADLGAAMEAVNEGAVFRFLAKPCAPEALVAALDAGIEQHRLQSAERVLLEQTLRGCVQVLTNILALAQPEAFGRASRARRSVAELARRLDLPEPWQLEVAAMLSQIGSVTLPPRTAERLDRGEELSASEQEMVDHLPSASAQLLAGVPRLEEVCEILAHQRQRFDGSAHGSPESPAGERLRGEAIPLGARCLRIVQDFDLLETQGLPLDQILQTMRRREGWYDPRLLEGFLALHGGLADGLELREIPLREIRAGMVFAQDVRAANGLLLISRGHEATAGLIARIRNFAVKTAVQEPIRVILPARQAGTGGNSRDPSD